MCIGDLLHCRTVSVLEDLGQEFAIVLRLKLAPDIRSVFICIAIVWFRYGSGVYYGSREDRSHDIINILKGFLANKDFIMNYNWALNLYQVELRFLSRFIQIRLTGIGIF
jgi:hypothetical protein